MNSKRIQTLAAAMISFLLLIYVGYQAYRSTTQSIVTEIAMYGSVSDTVQAQGFAIRSEYVITDTYSGVLSYRVADGTRVANETVLADVFASEDDAAAQNRLDRLDREIESLEALSKPADFFDANPTTLSTQIYNGLGEIFSSVRSGGFTEVASLTDSLQTSLSRKQLVTKEETSDDYQARLTSLYSERESLSATAAPATTAIKAPAAGYFISSTDGFENVYDISKIKEITAEQVRSMLGREQGTGLSSSVGKICPDFNWYLVCVFSDETVWKFEDVEDVSLDIPFASTETIPAKVVAKNRDRNTGDTAVVFECSYMDSDIALVRNETVEVCVQTYTGVLVNEDAIRFENVTYYETDENGNTVQKMQPNVKGVYIKNGRQLEFVQIFSEQTVNGYAICKTELSDDERAALRTSSTIQLYDNVVVSGTNLYDGKPVQ